MFSLGFNLYGRYTAKTLAVCVKHLSINQSINQSINHLLKVTHVSFIAVLLI